VAQPIPPALHSYEYRLAYVVGGQCVLRFANEHGKGDHLHPGGVESAYTFISPEQLMTDFEGEIARWNDEHGRS
jgi:hypothetical protein